MVSRKSRWMSVADPVHGIIRFDRNNTSHRLVLDVVNSKTFQRLRRIKQMGLAEFVFPNATHSRFVHSLGATYLMAQAIEHFNHHEPTRKLLKTPFEDTNIPLERLLLLGILIHDIGHGPLSHTLEDILGLPEQGMYHDHYWNRKILTEAPDLLEIWQRYDPQLPEAVLKFMGEKSADPVTSKHFLATLISSQLDMDRLDYLQRDSHFLGVKYGQIEEERIIGCLEIAELANGQPVVAVREEAIPAIEHYLFGRFQAYKMALHVLDKASEALLKKTLERFRWARDNGINTGDPAEALYQLMINGKSLSTAQYLKLDDCYLWQALNRWADESADLLLKDLANRMLQHNIFKFVDLQQFGFDGSLQDIPTVYETLKQHYMANGLDFDFGYEETIIMPKAMYQPSAAREPIWIRTSQGEVVDLASISSLPLTSQPSRGMKTLLFVWDKSSREVLRNGLKEHFGNHPLPEEELIPAEMLLTEDEGHPL